jgi:hypothetical protein
MPLLWIQNIIGNCLRFRNVCIQTASDLNWNPTVVTFFCFASIWLSKPCPIWQNFLLFLLL